MHPTLTLFVLLAACGGSKQKIPDQIGPVTPAPQNLFLRTSFDVDPSGYLGRFVPSGEEAVDESSSMQLSCSKHIEWRRVDGGGVIYDELFNASSEAAVRIGVPVLASAGGQGGAHSTVRVRYELTEKMVADIKDPEAFEACCKRAPDQCTDRFIGEFIAGKGSVFYQAGHGGSGGGDGITPKGVTVDLDMKHGVLWQQSVEFPNPVFFAFKTTRNHWTPDAAPAGCGPWVDGPPMSSQGQYFVGISVPLKTEMEARDFALRNGREQAVRWVAESIESGSLQTMSTSGSTDSLTTMLEDERLLQTASSGVARLVKDQAWCVQPQETPGGDIYVAKVLMFLPEEQRGDVVEVLEQATGENDEDQ